MKKHTLTQPTTLGAAVKLKLTEDQAALRAGRVVLLDKKKGVYQTLDEVHFKAGEVVEIDADQLPRALQVVLEPMQEQLP